MSELKGTTKFSRFFDGQETASLILAHVYHALEAKGAIRGFDRQTPAGRTRRYYAITDKGRRQLKEETEQWQSFSGAVNTVLGFAG